MPITFFEGMRGEERSELRRRNMEHRFYELAAAVRDHESRTRDAGPERDRHDEHLYRRLRQLCGEPAGGEHGAA
jgi:hypothetical protein